jgi:hypothetical protein
MANFARFGAEASTALDAPLILYVPLIRISFWRFDSRGRGLDAVVSRKDDFTAYEWPYEWPSERQRWESRVFVLVQKHYCECAQSHLLSPAFGGPR